MNRLKLLAAAMLLAVPIACGDEVPPFPPTGSIDGLVSIEGQGIDAVSVTLSNGASAITANGGMYRFDGVEAGAYTVTISNYPDDASFNQTSAAATITTDGQNVTVNFPGTYIRTSSIMGTVTVDNEGLGGVTVSISGTGDSETLTDGNGQYAFTGLRAGNYTIEISGFDDEDVAFGSTSSSAVVGVGESKVVSFEGTYVRTSGIMGQVTADDQPQEGVTVSLQGRGENRSMTTNSAGQFSFDELRRGDYAVGISGYNTDEVSFDETSQSVTVAYGETANVPFEGILLRTAGIEGTVMVEGVGPIANVTVTISGEGENLDATTDNMGAYAFEGLAAGEYSVVISGFDDDEYGFPDGTSATVTVELQETGTVPFEGIMLRTAAIEGTVTVGDNDAPLPGVMVTVSGGPRDEEHATTTNDNGMYMVENLHAGTYSVTISGYDTREYGFEPTTKTLTVDLRDTGEAAFQGELLRTAGVSGRVHVDGMGIPGVTVTMTGEESRQGTTDADGQYGFSGLAAGDYTITISDWDEVEYAFEPTMEIALELNESMSGVNFSGKALRTATVKGYVTVEGDALPGIAVTLIRVVSANSGEILGAAATGQNGGYSFGPLLAGAYQVMIAGYTDEHDFAAGTTQTTIVMTDSTATVNFAATIIRTASVSGMVTVDGEAMAGVEVTLSGDHAGDDNTMMTDEDGYSFGGLRKGDYTVSIENPDADAYSFPSTSQALNLSVGQEQDGISFSGARLQQASISGQVHAEGDPVAGVMVTLSGDADAEDVTNDNGEYNFPSLAIGDYTVTISDWDDEAYSFEPAEQTKEGEIVNTDDFLIVDFAGTHTKTASIGGMLFIDEGGATALARDEGEPVLDLDAVLPEGVPGLPITLLGPELTSPSQLGFASREGVYSFGSLRAGTYVINVDVEMEIPLPTGGMTTVEAVLAMLGYKYTGPSLNTVTVAAAEESDDNNLPFSITLQTINVGAVMGTPDAATESMVGGVELALYPTAEAADAGEPMLGTATTGADPEMPNHGIATFHFPRAMDLGPGGTGNDHLVFAKVVSTGHDDLAFSDNRDIEIQYAATDRVSNAHAAARLVNVQVNFQWWAKSNETAKDGNMVLGGWVANNEMATDATGLATYSGSITVDEAIAGAKYEVMLAEAQHDTVSGKERWTQSAALTHAHNHLALPADNTSEMNDLGPIYVTWTTQTLTLGVYREADDVEGFTDFQSELAGGDHRPHSEVGSGMTVDLMTRDSRNRLRVFDEWDHDCDDDGEKEMPTEERDATGNFAAGMISFKCLPADEQFTVRYNAGDDREQMDYDYDEIETFGNDLDHGVTLGAFGAMSGAGPEVRMCSASDPNNADATSDEWTDEWCATFAYQWETGQVYGNVGQEEDHEVEVTPETGHGAIGDDDETDEDGAYSIGGLQDGVYTAKATSTDAKYQLLDPAEEEGVALYHNEACWAATNPDPATGDERPSACAANEVIEGEDDDGNTTYTYANRANVSWKTGRLGLAIKGYVANDGQDGEDLDGLLRGDESMADIEMTLYDEDNENAVSGVDPVKTNASGFYSFENLEAGSYTVRAGTASNALAIHAIAKDEDDDWEYVTWKSATAQDYPTFPDEADLPKPFWDRANTAGGTMGQPTTRYTVGTGTAAKSATLYNFALVYTDGELSGRVNNLSGSNASIDIIISTPNPLDDDEKVETVGSRGNFELGDLIEAMGYTAEIEDAGFTAPCMGADGMPDDDLEAADGTCGPGNSRFPTELTADIEGESDHESLGTLTVYNTRMSSGDAMTAIEVMGQTAVGGDDVDLADGVTIGAQSTDATAVSVRTGPITFASESVTVDATVSGDAGVVVMMGDEVCAADVCKLDFNATGSDETSNASTEITVMVTAENGYDDHAYTFSVSRTNPVDNVLERGEILTQAGMQAGGSGGDGETAGNPWQVTTASEDSAAITLTFNLEEIGTGDDAICGQSISVKINGGADQDAINDTDNDACDDEQYRLSAGTSGRVYEITITSQDDEAKKYYINLRRAAGSVNEAPEVTTEIPDQSLSVNATREVDVSSNFSDPNDDNLDFTAASDDQTKATVSVTGSVVTIAGVAEGSAEITVTATDPGGLTVTDAFSVTVQAASANEAPEVATPIDDQTVKMGATKDVDVESNFSDADNDNLTFTAVSDATGTATVTVSGSVVTITGVAVGGAEITVTANDGNGGTVADAFSVTVEPASVNQAPEVATAIDDQMVEMGATEDVDVATNFSDADNDNLEFTAASDDQTKATVSVTGSVVTITGVAEGTANITVTADDGNGGTVDDVFEVTVSVPNQAPEVATAIDDQSLEAGETKEVDVSSNFSDADDDALTFTAMGDDDTKATVTVTGSMLTITGVAVGSAEITVTADDGNGGTVEDAFEVTVTPTSPALLVSIEKEAIVREGTERDYTVRLAAQPNVPGDVTVAIAVDAAEGSGDVNHVTVSRASLTFNEQNWNRARTVTIVVAEETDQTDEESEVAEVTHTVSGSGNYASVDPVVIMVTAEDNDVVAGAAINAATSITVVEEATPGAELMVKLAAEPTGDVTVSATLDPVSGVAGIESGDESLTFTTLNWNTEQGITITGTADDDPVDAEAKLTLDASGGGYGSAEDVEVTVNVDDDEDATISIADGVSGAEVLEGGTMTYNVTLSAPPPTGEEVRVNLSVTGPASVSPAQALFEGATVSVPITVTPFSDSDDSDESVTISHSVDATDGSGYENATAPSNVSVTIKDDEAAGVVVSRTVLSVDEGQMVEYTVRLTTAPSTDEIVTINLAGTGVNLSETSITFDATNAFDQPQTVTVTGHVDGDDGDDAATVVHTVTTTGGDEDYDGVTASTVTITVKEPSDE